jgi:hypothetical protein
MGLRGRTGIIYGLHSDNFINSFIAASFIIEGQKKFRFWEPKSAIFNFLAEDETDESDEWQMAMADGRLVASPLFKPISKSLALRQSRQRLECGGFSTAFGVAMEIGRGN